MGSQMHDLNSGQRVALAYLLLLKNCADISLSEQFKGAAVGDPEMMEVIENLGLAVTYASSILSDSISTREDCECADVSITVENIAQAFRISLAESAHILDFV